MRQKAILLGVMLLLASGLWGCSVTTIRTEQPIRDRAIALNSSTAIGQTFSVFYDGLQGVVIHLEPVQPGDGEILFHLRRSLQDTVDLRNASLRLDQISTAADYSFEFRRLTDSHNSDYFLLLELKGTGQVNVGFSENQEYLLGSMVVNGQPKDAQLYFGLSFQTLAQWLGILQESITWWGWFLAGVFLFVLPGWALLKAFWADWNQLSFWEKFGLGSGVSLALYPLLLVFTDLAHFKMGAGYAWIPGVSGGLFLLWKNAGSLNDFRTGAGRERLRAKCRVASATPLIQLLSPFPWEFLTISILVFLVFVTRFYAIRTVDVPMWGDAVQHTVIAQLLLDHKGLFTSWEPYAPYQSLTVHFGFPAHTAVFSWLTGLPSHTATLIVSQWINALAVITLIPLAYRFSPKISWAAAGTILFAGLLSPMPAFYINWGRFAQLDGQAILPVGIWLTWGFFERNRQQSLDRTPPHPRPHWKTIQELIQRTILSREFWFASLVIGLTLAGMTLTYYRTIFYYAAFFPGLLVGWILSRQYRTIQEWLALGLGGIAIGSISLAFLFPWLKRMMGSSLSGMVAAGMNDNSSSSFHQELLGVQAELAGWLSLENYLPLVLAGVAAIAFLWSLYRKRWDVAAAGVWALTLQAYQIGRVLHLPAANMLQVFAIMIWIYLPASLLTGWMVGEISAWLQRRYSLTGQIALVAFLIGTALLGANRTRLVAMPAEYSLAVRPDLGAMAWIEQNVPEDARFLVEGYRIYAGRSVVGSDAGWWIPLFTKRQNTMPPQYALLNEVPNSPDFSARMVALVAWLEENPIMSPESLELLCDEGITHVFIGQRGGRIGADASQLFSPQELIAAGVDFSLIYHQDAVYIFALDQAVCRK